MPCFLLGFYVINKLKKKHLWVSWYIIGFSSLCWGLTNGKRPFRFFLNNKANPRFAVPTSWWSSAGNACDEASVWSQSLFFLGVPFLVIFLNIVWSVFFFPVGALMVLCVFWLMFSFEFFYTLVFVWGSFVCEPSGALALWWWCFLFFLVNLPNQPAQTHLARFSLVLSPSTARVTRPSQREERLALQSAYGGLWPARHQQPSGPGLDVGALFWL